VGEGFVVPYDVEEWIKIVRQDLNEVFIAIEEAKAFQSEKVRRLAQIEFFSSDSATELYESRFQILYRRTGVHQ